MTVATRVRPGDLGLDYAWWRPTLADLVGVTWVCRYLAKLPNGKVIQGSEVQQLHEAGIAILLNWEQSAGDPLKGATVGRDHGRLAKAQAENLGYPYTLPIIASVDVGLTFVTKGLALDYLKAFAEAIHPYPLGVYGGTPIINAAVESAGCVLGWRANAPSWSPLSESTANVHIRQRTQDPSNNFDPNTCVITFDAWLPRPDVKPDPIVIAPPTPIVIPPDPVVRPTPVQPDQSEEDEMLKTFVMTGAGGAWLMWLAADGKVRGIGLDTPADVTAHKALGPVVDCSDDQVRHWLERLTNDAAGPAG